MSAEVAYRQPFTSDMSSQYGNDRGALLNGLRTSPRSQQQFANLNMYQQQQMQMAMYQQQQMELCQQQAQLEMQLQLEQMRLQNLALQEQIMLGQAAQAQAQAEDELQQRRGVYQLPQKSSVGARFAAAQGGVLAERAMARRQAQESASYRSDEGDAVKSPVRNNSVPAAFQTPVHHRRTSSTNSFLSSSTSPRDPNAATPALVLSKPGEAFPSPPLPAEPTSSYVSHQHTDSGSSASTRSSLSSFLHHSRDQSDVDTVESPSSESLSFGGKASPPLTEERKWRAVREAESPKVGGNGSPKLNPFSSVFVPSSAAMTQTASEPVPAATSGGVYRAPRAGSPPSRGSPVNARVAANVGAVPVRQPRGPPSHAEDLATQNFNARLRKRAIAGIRSLGVRVPASPEMREPGGMLDAAHGLPAGMVSPGLAALIAATKAREERMRGEF